MGRIFTNTRGEGSRLGGRRRWRVTTTFAAAAVGAALLTQGVTFDNTVYLDHLEVIRSQSVRNTNEDNSPFRDVKVDELVDSDLYGLNDRSDYIGLGNPGNYEAWFPVVNGGQFRTACEFSHFAYDDPILFPDQPGAAHLHMFFGNTDVNAYTTQETLEDSGGGTCNGAELNRSGYWAPAMFDGNGNVRIPEEIVIYYKGEGYANGGPNGRFSNFPNFGGVFNGSPNPGSQIYERGMRAIAPNPQTVTEVASSDGGLANDPTQVNYKCTGNFSGPPTATGRENIPLCDGNNTECGPASIHYPNCRAVLEMEVDFWGCFPNYDENNPNSPANPDITDWTLWEPLGPGLGSWFQSDCHGLAGGNGQNTGQRETYTNFNYFITYVVEPGETTEDWFLSSDVVPSTLNQNTPSLVATGPGSTHHGDVWWSWKESVLQMALDNCVNFWTPGVPSGCASGWLTNAGVKDGTPNPGPSLVPRQQYDTVGDPTSTKTPISQLFNEICQPLGPAHSFVTDRHGAYCTP